MLYFPLPYSSLVEDHKPKLSAHSLTVLKALLVLYKPGDAVLLIAEKTYNSKTETTGKLMKEFLSREGLPNGSIRVADGVFNNTDQQLRELKKQIGNAPVTLIAFSFHAKRVKLVSKRLGLHFTLQTVEMIIDKSDIPNTPLGARLYEKLIYLLALLDANGAFQNWYSNKFGPRAPLL